jgi:hypothetical protein
MNKNPATRLQALFLFSFFFLSACGARFNGSYTLNQQGQLIQSRSVSGQNCSQIVLSINESSSTISGQGQNPCFTETIQGQTSNGQASVMVTISPNGSGNMALNGYNTYGSGATGGCSYQGMLTLSGNSISGTLNPVNSAYNVGDCSGTITLSGTRN